MGILLAVLLALTQDAEIDRLIRTLGSDDPRERERAEKRLVELCAKARPAVIRATKDENPEIAARAREVLRSAGFRMEELFDAGFRPETARAIPDFARRFWSSTAADRIGALKDLADHGTPENLAAVATVLRREELTPEVRLACLDLAEKVKKPQLAPLFIPLLSDPAQSQHRMRIDEVLVACDAKDAAPLLFPLLEMPDTVSLAVNLLEKLGVPLPEDSLRRMLRTRNEHVIGIAVGNLQKRRLSGFSKDLIDLLCRGEGRDCAWLVQDALRLSGPSWKELEPLLSVTAVHARLIGLRVALAARQPEAFEAALALLDDEHEETKTEAREVATYWGGPEALRRLKKHPGPGALIALARTGDPVAKERATTALGSDQAAMRTAAITALRALDAHDQAAAILPKLDDPDPEVRTEAARVLPHLGGDTVGRALIARLEKETESKVQAQLLHGIADTAPREAAPIVLRFLKQGGEAVGYAATRAAGSLQLREAAPILVQGYVTGKPPGLEGAYEALLQIRAPNLVELLRPHLKPQKKEEDDGRFKRIVGNENRTGERPLYLLYVDPPGAKELFLECLKNEIVPRYPVEEIRFLGAEEAFPWLIQQIENGNERGNHGAGRLLASYGRKELIDPALGWLFQGRTDFSLEFLQGMKAEEKIPELAARLDDPDEKVRGAAHAGLNWIGGPKAIDVFRRRMKTGTPLRQAITGHTLASMGDQDCIPALEALLEDDSTETRVWAAYGLYLLDSKSSFDRVVRAYRRGIGKSDWVWPYAIATLGGARGRELVRPMLEAAKDPQQRIAVLSALGQGDGASAEDVAYLEKLLADRELGSGAWNALLRLDPVRGSALLADARYRLGLMRGNWATSYLESVRHPASVPALIALLRDRDANTRSHAALILDQRRLPEAAEPLAKALHDESEHVRRYAALGLAHLGDARGVDELLRQPRWTTVGQGRLGAELTAFNFLRRPEASRKLAEIRWTHEGPPPWTLRDALDDLAKRTGMKVTVSKAVPERAFRFPLDYPGWEFPSLELAQQSPWNRFISFIVESDEIRVVTPDEAFSFWEQWAKGR